MQNEPDSSAPLSSRDRRTRDDFIRLFGGGRFTIRDLWREWVGRARGPTRDFVAEMETELARLAFVEPAPGPRGGQGWRVRPAVVDELERDRADQAVWVRQRNEAHRPAAEALTSRYADIEVVDDPPEVRVAYPNLTLPPRWIDMRLQEVTVGAVIGHWCRRHRYKGIKAGRLTATLTCDWRYAAKMATVIAKLDELVSRHIAGAIKHHRGRLAELESIIDKESEDA